MSEKIFAVNGFYMDIRSSYVKSGSEIIYYNVEWDQEDCNYNQFTNNVIGDDDPENAVEGSIRQYIYEQYKSLGIKSKPTAEDNCIYGSKSPFEALCEKVNWINIKLRRDPFSKILLDNGFKDEELMDQLNDHQVEVKKGKFKPIFEILQDMDSDECLKKFMKLKGKESSESFEIKNSAFIFIKPNASNDKVIKYVEEKLEKEGIIIIKKGKISSEKIEENKLIDNHYSQISSYAYDQKPFQMTVTYENKSEFQQFFGVNWDQMLKDNGVFNAHDAIELMGIDDNQMTKEWNKSKSQNKILKFSEGFQIAEIEFKPTEQQLANRNWRMSKKVRTSSTPSISLSDKQIDSFKIIVIGSTSVGKSCLTTRFKDEKFEEEGDATVGVIPKKKEISLDKNDVASKNITVTNDVKIKLQIWDTAGQETFKSMIRAYYRDAAAAIICYSITDRKSFEQVANWLKEPKEHSKQHCVYILIGCQKDRESERKVLFQEGQQFCDENNMDLFFETSAKSGENIETVFKETGKLCLQQYAINQIEEEKNKKNNFQQSQQSDTHALQLEAERELTKKKCC